MDDLDFMREALALAKQASEQGEVPVGCVITRGEEIVGRGYNRRETDKSALAHAEIQAIDEGCKRLGGWRLWECTMCAGAILRARIPRVVYGASDQKFGACKSVCSLFDMNFNHHPQVVSGVMEEESAALLRSFFQNLRVELRSRPKWRKPGESF